jgi:hypothetical protein
MTDIDQLKRQEIRWLLLKNVYRQRPQPLQRGLALQLLKRAGYLLTNNEILKELDYLRDKGLLASSVADQWCGTALMIEVVEGHGVQPPGISVYPIAAEAELLRLCEIRWRILRALDYSRPLPLSVDMLSRVLEDLDLHALLGEIERELVYLEELSLIEKEGQGYSLTGHGVDVVQYEIDAPASINRPEKYWEE